MSKSLETTKQPAEAGMTLIEVMIAAMVLSTAIVAMLGVIITNSRVKVLAQEQYVALNAAQAKMAEIRSRSYDDLWLIYNDDSSDDPGGVWPASPWTYADELGGNRTYSHNMFDVPGLHAPQVSPTQTDPHGIVVIVDSETPDEAAYGDIDISGSDADGDGDGYTDNPAWTMDLNDDGDANDVTAAQIGTFAITPVVVVVRWQSTITGRTELVMLRSFLVNRRPV